MSLYVRKGQFLLIRSHQYAKAEAGCLTSEFVFADAYFKALYFSTQMLWQSLFYKLMPTYVHVKEMICNIYQFIKWSTCNHQIWNNAIILMQQHSIRCCESFFAYTYSIVYIIGHNLYAIIQ